MIHIDEDHETWINLMYGRDAAKSDQDLRQLMVERLAPEVLRAADECTSYEDFKRLVARYRKEGAAGS